MNPITPSELRELKSFSKLIVSSALLCYAVIVLGSLVRATDSGLACPDWPLCYNQLIPLFDTQIFLEWFHRLIAGGLGILIAVALIFVLRRPHLRKAFGAPLTVAAILLAAQIVLGGLTVLKLLDPKTVAAHLINATLFFSVILWISWRAYALTSPLKRWSVPITLRWLSSLLGIGCLTQIALGGMVSSNYAGLACPDFPTCFGSWIPDELSFPIILQLGHRGFGFVLTLFAIVMSMVCARLPMPPVSLWMIRLVPTMLVAQVALGILNIVWSLPVGITVLHLANGIAIYTLVLSAIIEQWLITSTEKGVTDQTQRNYLTQPLRDA